MLCIYKIDVAKYRSGEMQVVSGAMGKEKVHYQAPSAERVSMEMSRFLEWINNDNDTEQYYDILEKTQHGDGEITEWLLWFIGCLDEALNNTETTLGSVMEKHLFWEKHDVAMFNQRQQKIINLLLDGFEGNMTTGRWARICHCSRDTALKDANDLVAKGILQLGEAGGRSTNYTLAIIQ